MTLIGGRYDLRRMLGAPSAEAEVYEAEDTHEGDIVALKLFKNIVPGGEWLEAQILRRLTDRHILPIRNADLANGRPYLVTELATQGSLDGPLRKAGPCGLNVDDVIRWIRHACGGVGRAHDLGLLHNDLKPGNLFIDAENECLVGDFGGASLLPPGASGTRPMMFTVATVAPEIAADQSGDWASFASDIYSLGATAYWLIAGQPPHDTTGMATPVALAHVASVAPPRLFDVAPHVPTQVQTVIETAMAHDPADRYDSVGELAAALGDCTRRPGRRWQRTDDHGPHVACFTGISPTGASDLALCVEPGSRATKANITTRSASGNKVSRACRTDVPMRTWAQAVRSAMRDAK